MMVNIPGLQMVCYLNKMNLVCAAVLLMTPSSYSKVAVDILHTSL